MPSYNQDIFNNSILMKRLNQTGQASLTKAKEAESTANKVERGDAVYKESNPEEIGNMMTNNVGDGNNHIYANHIIYQRDPGAFASNVNKFADNAVPISKDLVVNNADLFKSMLTSNANGGLIFADQNVKIDVKIKTLEKGCLGLMFTFIPTGNRIEDIELTVSSNTQELNIQISKIKYPQEEGQQPQALMKVFLNSSFSNPPTVNFSARVGMMTVNSNFALPLVITKFLEPLDMPVESYTPMLYEFTNSPDNIYHKMDVVMNNPMENRGTVMDFLKKIGGLLNSLNFRVYPPSNMSEFHEIDAVASLNYESGSIPVLLQIAFLPSYTGEFRLSARAKVNDEQKFGNLLQDVYSVIRYYISPY